jgi:hypothetical protein
MVSLNIQKALVPAFIVLGSIVGLLVLAGFIGPYFDATSSITENFTTADTGNDQANGIIQVFGFVIPIVLALGLVALVIAVGVMTYKKGN